MIRRWLTSLTANQQVVAATVSVVIAFGSLGWASVPLYDLFCRVTGYGGTTQIADGAGVEVIDHKVMVRFDASKAHDMPWDFTPVQRSIDLNLGETALVFYEAHNPTDRPIAGTASFNVTPYAAGPYFAKIDCFCFEEQVLMPGETVQMPVTFYVHPDMLSDSESAEIVEITLSYTFHVTDMPEDYAANTEAGPMAEPRITN